MRQKNKTRKIKSTLSNEEFCEISTQYYEEYKLGWEHIPYAFEGICVLERHLVLWNQEAIGSISVSSVQKTEIVLSKAFHSQA